MRACADGCRRLGPSRLLAIVGLLIVLTLPPVAAAHSTASNAAPLPWVLTSPIRHGLGAEPRATPNGAASPLRHPGPAPLARSASYSGHYYSGSAFTGTPRSASEVSAEISVPRDSPYKNDFYYVLVSLWDNAGSYDQIGFAGEGGIWGLVYSTTSHCAGSYYNNNDAWNLTAGTTYRFTMAAANGTITFHASIPGSGNFWNYSNYTGATALVVADTYTCGSTGLDYTDYEEVYGTQGTVPPWPFVFQQNEVDQSLASSWTGFNYSLPATIHVAVSGANTTIENVPFALAVPATLPADLGAKVTNFSVPIGVEHFWNNTQIGLTVAGSVTGALLSVSPSSGKAPFGANLTVHLTSFATSGSALLEVYATDPSGVFARLQITVVVSSLPSVGAPQASPAHVDVGQNTTLTVNPTGGSPPYRVEWVGVPTGCPGTAMTIVCQSATAGSYSISAQVTDLAGVTVNSSTISLVVSPALVAKLSPRPSSIDLGQSVRFSVATSGGSGGLHFNWSLPKTVCAGGASVYVCTPSVTGAFSARVTVTDSNGGSASTPLSTVSVFSDPSVNVTADRPSIDVGQSGSFRATLVGGAGNDQVTWSGVPPDCTPRNLTAFSCPSQQLGAFAVSVSVLDADGFSVNSSALPFVVYADPRVSLEASSASVSAGALVRWSATVSGGSGGETFLWSGLPPGCANENRSILSCTVSGTGHFNVRLNLSDSNGLTSTAGATLNVTIPTPTALTTGTLLLIAGGGSAVVVATAAVLVLRRKPPLGRRSRP
ncbi:MAG: hypothetical protein L3K09_06845 [Thermoplasmata archaeon]|nr:hypothetical protein [Thermoplasmata archaeon]